MISQLHANINQCQVQFSYHRRYNTVIIQQNIGDEIFQLVDIFELNIIILLFVKFNNSRCLIDFPIHLNSIMIEQEAKPQINYKQLYEKEKARRIQVEKHLQLQKIKVKKLISGKLRGKLCPQCLAENQTNRNRNGDLFIDPLGFSSKVDSVLSKKKEDGNSSPTLANSLSMTDSSKNKLESSNHISNCPIIQNFAVFGIPEGLIPQGHQIRSIQDIEGQILFSSQQPSDIEKQAARFVFPSGMAVKKLVGQKAKDKALEMMSFCYTNLKSFILSFECPQNRFSKQDLQQNKILQYLNPQRKLFCICIGIHDYTWLQNKKRDKFPTSLSLNDKISSKHSIQQNQSNQKIPSVGVLNNEQKAITQGLSSQSVSIKSIKQNQLSVAMSQRVFCIMSYYPFFTFFEDIIRNIINIVKMQRLTIYQHRDEDIKNTDSIFQLERIKELYSDCLKQLANRKIQYNRVYQLKLINGQRISLMTDHKIAKNYFVDEWIFPILNMFSYETFIELYTLIMLQDRIVFVCQNSHILTHTIYLFANLLPKPFKYAFPVVNIIPNQEEFLNAPFPIIYGMLKKRKYVEEKNFVENYLNTYVFLHPDRIEIVSKQSKKHLLKRKPLQLKNQLASLFKQLKKRSKVDLKNIKLEHQVSQYCILSTSEQKQVSIKILDVISRYNREQLQNKLPTHSQVKEIKQNLDRSIIPKDKDQHSYMMQKISTQMIKSNKDPFFQKFLDTQMINVYLFQ